MPERPEVAPQNKKLAVFLDGTWNAVADNTNVWRMKSLCSTAVAKVRLAAMWSSMATCSAPRSQIRYKEFMSGAYCKMSHRHYRHIGADPEKREDGTHRNVNETIDTSLFDRWREVPQYRPPNLNDWAERKSVDPASFRQSVTADNPKIGAPD